MSFPPEFGPMEGEESETPPLAPQPQAELNYNVKLSEKERKELGRRVVSEVDHYDDHVAPRLANAREWRDAAALMPDASQDMLGEASAGIRASDTRRVCQAHTTRLDSQVLGSDPLFTAEPLDAEAVEAVPAIEEVVKAYLDDAEHSTEAHVAHKDLPIVSPLAVRTMWKRETARRPKHAVEVDEQAALMMVQQGADPMQAMNAATEQDEQGRAKVFFEHEDVVTHDGLELRVIPFEDLILLPGTANRPDDLWGIGERVRLRGMDLKRGAKEGVYIKSEVDELLKSGSSTLSDRDRSRGETSGITSDSDPSAEDLPRYREYTCVELCWKDDLDDDGYEEWYLLTVDLESERVLRCQYLPWAHGEPHYTVFAYDPEAGKLWGQSIAELMAVPQDAMSAAKNAFFNLLTLKIAQNGSGLYEGASGFDPDNFTLQPGAWIKVNNLQGIQPWPLTPDVPQTLQAILAYLEAEKGQVDLLTAAADTSLGATTENNTLGEVKLALGQSLQNFEGYASSVSRCWARVYNQCRRLIAQYGADEAGNVTFRKKAEAGKFTQDEMGQQVPVAMVMGQEMPAPGGVVFHSVPAYLLEASVKIQSAGFGLPDSNTRVQRDLLLLEVLSAHPLTAQDWPTQAILIDQLLQDTKLPQRDKITASIQQQIAMLEMQAMMQQQMMMQQAGTQQAQAEQDMSLKGQEAERAGQQQQMDQYTGLLGAVTQEQDIEDRMKGKPPAGNGAKKK